jgi:hypothetical protein
MDIVVLWFLVALALFALVTVLNFIVRLIFGRRPKAKVTVNSDWEVLEFGDLAEARPRKARLMKSGKNIDVIGFASRDGKAFLSSLVPGCWSVFIEPDYGHEFFENAIAVFGMVSETSEPIHLGYLPPEVAEDVKLTLEENYQIWVEPIEIGWKKVTSDAYMKLNLLVVRP